MIRIQHHPIGFKKITLFSFFGYKLRLHVWPQGKIGCRLDIHDHRWSFVSIPLRGTFTERRYVSTDGSTYTVSHCFSEPIDGERPVTISGVGEVQVYMEKIRKPVRPYICRAFVIHSHMPNETTRAMSLVLTFPPKREYANVWHENQESA